MSTELRQFNYAQELYLTSLTGAYRRSKIRYPSLWSGRDPEVAEKMLRDATIGQAVRHRCLLVAGRDWDLTPMNPKDPMSDLSVAVGRALLKCIKKFTDSRRTLARAFFHGSRYAVIHLHKKILDIGDGKRREWMVPVRLEDQNRFRYRKVIDDPHAEKVTAHWEKWEILGKDGGQWKDVKAREARLIIGHVFDDTEEGLGYGRGLQEALGWPWYALTHTNQETLGAIERFARGWIVARVDKAAHAESGLPNTEVVKEWTKKLEQMQGKHVMVLSKDDTIEVLKGSSEGYQMLDNFVQRLENMVDRLVLAAKLPTGGGGDNVGSLARAGVEETSTQAVVGGDRDGLEETLTDDLIGCVWWRNWANLVELGIEEEKPRFSISEDKIEDPEKVAQNAAVLHGMGMPLAMEDVYDRTGFRQPEQGEDILEGATAPAPAPDFGGGGFGFSVKEREPFGVGIP